MKKVIILFAVLMCLCCAVGHAAESGMSFGNDNPYTNIANAYQVTTSDFGKVMSYSFSKNEDTFLTIVAPSNGTFYITCKQQNSSIGFNVYNRAQKKILDKTVYVNNMYVYKYQAGAYEKLTVELHAWSSSTRAGTLSICFDGYHVPGLFNEVTKEPTCTEPGEITYPCELCDGPAKTETIPAAGHKGNWKVTKQATCTEAGTRSVTCTVCKQTVTESIPATGHTPGNWVTVQQATSSREGKQTKSCTVCGTVLETKTIPKTTASGNLTATATPMDNDGNFTVVLGIKNNPGIGYISVSLSASNAVNIKDVQTTGIARNASVTSGTKIVLFASDEIEEDGSIITISLNAVSRNDVTVNFAVEEAYNVSEQAINISGVSVDVHKGGLIGDCNGDGSVDGRDVLRLARYLAGSGVSVDMSASDVNRDGKVDGRDVLRLAKMLAGN